MRYRFRKNYRKGKVTEEVVATRYRLLRYELEPTGRGSDFYVTKRDILGNIIDSGYIEVKAGDSRLSELQQDTKKRKG